MCALHMWNKEGHLIGQSSWTGACRFGNLVHLF